MNVGFLKNILKPFDMFPRTEGENDINVVFSSHVETVVLLSRVEK